MVSLRDSTPPSEVQEEFYQARKKLGDEAQKLPAGVIGPVINDEYADVTFALFALKAKGEPQRLLARDAESLRQQLLHVPGVKKSTSSESSLNVFSSLFPMTVWPLWASPLRTFSPRSTARTY
jgi:multidrug efflux pump subunit AcrB